MTSAADGRPALRACVASTNPAKLRAAEAALALCFPRHAVVVEGVAAPSGVPDQPASDDETLEGATNRARNARAANAGYDLYVGLEGGVHRSPHGLQSFAWIYVVDSHGREGRGRTATVILPPRVAALVEEGVELGHANDRVFGVENSKHSSGAVGLLTNAAMDRTALYRDGAIMALVPFLHEGLYPK